MVPEAQYTNQTSDWLSLNNKLFLWLIFAALYPCTVETQLIFISWHPVIVQELMLRSALASFMEYAPFSCVKKFIQSEDRQWTWNRISAPCKDNKNSPEAIMSFEKFADKYRKLERGIITMLVFKKKTNKQWFCVFY